MTKDSVKKGAPQSGAVDTNTRLDKWTNCDEANSEELPPAYRAILRNYGQGVVEATVTIPVRKQRKQGNHKSTSSETDEKKSTFNKKRAIARARTTIRRTIMAAQLDHLLTLTYRENMKDSARAWRDYARFVRTLRERISGGDWPYIAVQELQTRGAIHIHAAVKGFQDVKLIRAIWHSVIGGSTSGNIDVQHFAGTTANLAKYLSKYISKGVGDGNGKGVHRYKRSRGIYIPGEVHYFSHEVAIDYEIIELFKEHSARVKFHKHKLEQAGPKWLWACSW